MSTRQANTRLRNLRASDLPGNDQLLQVAEQSGARNQRELVEVRLIDRIRARRGQKTIVLDSGIAATIADANIHELRGFFAAHLRKQTGVNEFSVYRDKCLKDKSLLDLTCSYDIIDYPSVRQTFKSLEKLANELANHFSNRHVAAVETKYTDEEAWIKVYKWKDVQNRPWDEELDQARALLKEIENELTELDEKKEKTGKLPKKDQGRYEELERRAEELHFPPSSYITIGYKSRR